MIVYVTQNIEIIQCKGVKSAEQASIINKPCSSIGISGKNRKKYFSSNNE
ncbi:hypothetical protein VRK_05190 [Vibrio sp. MEBiC08052]|nr:hypothetical protein VRK_05190 [Vibrio sp. MEBiC08052]